MKMFLGTMPINSLKIHQYDISTNDATVVSSDLQAGVTCYARGQKVVGTGKSFEFAQYGETYTNFPLEIPSIINVIEVASTIHPVKTLVGFAGIWNVDFSTPQNIASVLVNDVEYPITLTIQNGLLTLSCEQSLKLEVFYGKDNYI